ncbi:MAG: aminotransferase class V-fold PLP-dependent enzyme, partial [Rhizobiaceae bacterium]
MFETGTTVLVTGGAGFIGAHLVRLLVGQFPRLAVRVLDALTYAADIRRLSPLVESGRIEFMHGDVADPGDARAALSGVGIVFHLAAESHVPRSFADPGLFDRSNRLGTRTMLEAALAAGVRRFVHASTDEVYGPTFVPATEDAPLAPSTPYARSKADAEAEIPAARARGLDVRILRPTNAIGTGQHEEKLVPRFVNLLLAGQPLTIEGGGEQLRAFLPVGDLASAFLRVARSGMPDSTYNVAGIEEYSVLDMAGLVGEIVGRTPVLEFVADRAVNDRRYLLDDTRLRALGHVQASSVRQEIRRIVAARSKRQVPAAPGIVPALGELDLAIDAPRVAFHVPHRAAREAENVAGALSRGRFAAGGHYTIEAERCLRRITGAQHLFLTHSCTGAMEIAALALGLGPGDEVIVPTYTFCATATAFERTGARIVLADIDPRTMMIDPADVERRITPRTRAIVPVHYGGGVADMVRLRALAHAGGIALVEDAAQAIGARVDGRPVGADSMFAAFSFHETKIVQCGHGGALAVNGASPALLDTLTRILDRGTDFAAARRERRPFYEWTGSGSSFRPSELQAALLCGQLDDLESVIGHRRAIARLYAERLAPLAPAIRLLASPANVDANGHAVVLVADTADAAAALRARLGDHGIEAQTHYVPLHLSQAGRERGWEAHDCPVASAMWRRLLRLPVHGGMDERAAAR